MDGDGTKGPVMGSEDRTVGEVLRRLLRRC